jgi:hypothetical protein
MKSHGRLMVFSLIACIAYTLAYYFDWSLFQYYLQENRFHFTVQPASSGPPILWYGWLALAILAGGVVTLVLPPQFAARLPPDLLWLIPSALMLAALMYEMRWFL